jgi:hypothetical protein
VIIAGAANIDKGTVVTSGKAYFNPIAPSRGSSKNAAADETEVRNKP